MTQIRLSLCIATVNRARFIGATLDSIIMQATDEVEIVVVDGASTDNTQQVIEHYQQLFPRLQYLRLPIKGGVDQDYNRAVELARGDYCWLMSDDDLLKSGALNSVLKATHDKYGLIIVNAEVRNTDLSKILEGKLLPHLTNQVYKPAEGSQLFAEVGNYLSFIGGVVIRRQLWNTREREKYFGTAFIHVGVIFQSPLPENTLIIAEPLISIRYGNASWTSSYFSIWMFKWPELIWSFPHYLEAVKPRVVPREPWRNLKVLLICRAKGVFSLKEYRALLEVRLASRWEQLAARTIAQTPGCLVNLIAVVRYTLFHPQAHLVLADFQNSPFYYATCFRRLFHRRKS
jgi:glycosyltransferase involved in cell wall biosynthesis